ncbi:MAG: DUF342 domain-containing protein [Helicobacteraceae bacterium]|nr:DUF342 domain-containing protein [Helicobacteraceae bacterium]
MNKTLQTKDIKTKIEQYAKILRLDIEECDFELNEVHTAMKSDFMDTLGYYNKILQHEYHDLKKITEDGVNFRESYTVTIHIKKEQPFELEYKVLFAPLNSKAELLIKPSSNIPYKKYKARVLYSLLLDMVLKIKAFNHIIINLYPEATEYSLKKFIQIIYKNKFTKPFKILLFDGIEPEYSAPSREIEHYKIGKEDQKIYEVQKNALLVSFTKPVIAKNGFNVFGQTLKSDYFWDRSHKILPYAIDIETIKEEDNKRYIKLYSKKKGFVSFDNSTIQIKNEFSISEISRNDEKLSHEEDSEIQIKLTATESTKDSVGEGVNLKSNSIHIDGFVGVNATVEAVDLIVDGATHTGSILKAKRANIHTHRGVLNASEVEVDLLENGEIHGTNVKVNRAHGGSIYAKNVTINDVNSYVKVYASNSITINRISGEDNKFHFDYTKIPANMKEISFLEEEIEDLKYQIDEASRHRLDLLDSLNKQLQLSHNSIKNLKNSTFNATLEIKQMVRGVNIIIFQLNEYKQILFRTQPNKKYSKFYIEKTNIETATLHPIEKTIEL